jgi:hypothetical protein
MPMNGKYVQEIHPDLPIGLSSVRPDRVITMNCLVDAIASLKAHRYIGATDEPVECGARGNGIYVTCFNIRPLHTGAA